MDKVHKKEDKLQSCSVLLDFLIFGDGNDSFAKYICNELPLNTA